MNYEERFDEEYIQTLSDISNNMQETCVRWIHDAIDRFIRRGKGQITCSDVGCGTTEVSIVATNMKSTKTPDIALEHFVIEFENMGALAAFKMKEIEMFADYEGKSNILGIVNSYNGKIRILLKGGSLKGKLGMYIVEDSFMPDNFDMELKFDKIQVEMSQSGNLGEFKVIEDTDSRILSLFWLDIVSYFEDFCRDIITAQIVELSASETLIDEPEHLREYQVERIKIANETFDSFLQNLLTEGKSDDTINVAGPLIINLPEKKITFSCAQGILSDINTLSREKDTSLYQGRNENSYFSKCTFRKLTIDLPKCKITCGDKTFETNINLEPHRVKLFIKFDVAKTGEKKMAIKFINFGPIYTNSDIDDADFNKALDELHLFFCGYFYESANKLSQKLASLINK